MELITVAMIKPMMKMIIPLMINVILRPICGPSFHEYLFTNY
jgi:hypothetical protein